MRDPELCLAKRIQLVFVSPLRRKKDPRAEDKTLEMALRRYTPDLSKSEIGQVRRIPRGVVVGCDGHSLGEPPRRSNVEPVRAEIPGYVRPPAAYLQAL